MVTAQTTPRTRRDGWTPTRRADFLGALRVSGSVGEACQWSGMSRGSAYALARRDPDFAAAWDAALVGRDADRWSRRPVRKPVEALSDGALIRRLCRADAARHARPRGIVAQQNARWA